MPSIPRTAPFRVLAFVLYSARGLQCRLEEVWDAYRSKATELRPFSFFFYFSSRRARALSVGLWHSCCTEQRGLMARCHGQSLMFCACPAFLARHHLGSWPLFCTVPGAYSAALRGFGTHIDSKPPHFESNKRKK